MTEQLRFDVAESELAAIDGMALASSADRVQEWKTQASSWLARRTPGVEFTADDVTRAVGVPDEGPNRNNVVGAWFNAQARAGRIVFAGRMRKSSRVTRHGNVQRVWKKTEGAA